MNPSASSLISLVIPCYNEEPVLAETHRRINSVLDANGYNAEIILVDDGSKDDTWALMLKLAKSDCKTVGIKLSRNFGHEKALAAGLNEARGDRILILDADLQDPPELLPEMMRKMDDGFDTVYGKRISRKGESWLKKITSTLFYRFINLLSDFPIPHETGDFRLISRRVLDAYLSLEEDKRFNRLMFAWVGFRSCPIEYERPERLAGVTKYNYRKLMNLAIDGITSFSVRPLKIALFASFTMIVVALVIIVWVFRAWTLGGSVSGWASTISSILLVGSTQLFVIGIMGEYLGRLFIENKRRPQFIIEERLTQSENTALSSVKSED